MLNLQDGCWNCTNADLCKIRNGDLLLGTCVRWEQGENNAWRRRKERKEEE